MESVPDSYGHHDFFSGCGLLDPELESVPDSYAFKQLGISIQAICNCAHPSNHPRAVYVCAFWL